MSKEYTIRVMTLEDYDEVYALWMGIHGFGIRSIDDFFHNFNLLFLILSLFSRLFFR